MIHSTVQSLCVARKLNSFAHAQAVDLPMGPKFNSMLLTSRVQSRKWYLLPRTVPAGTVTYGVPLLRFSNRRWRDCPLPRCWSLSWSPPPSVVSDGNSPTCHAPVTFTTPAKRESSMSRGSIIPLLRYRPRSSSRFGGTVGPFALTGAFCVVGATVWRTGVTPRTADVCTMDSSSGTSGSSLCCARRVS